MSGDRKLIARDVAYLLVIASVWYSALVRLAAFVDPDVDPRWGAFKLDSLPAKIVSVATLLGWVVIVLVQPKKVKVLAAIRRLLLVPVSGGWLRFGFSVAALVGLAIMLQRPVMHTSRVWLHACGDEVKVCVAEGDACAEEIARLAPGKEVHVRARSGVSLIATAPSGELIWRGDVDGPSYSSPTSATDVCFQTHFDVACSGGTLQVFARNEGARALAIFGFELVPVYDAVYPQAAARVGVVPTYDPLRVALGDMRVQKVTGPKLVEIAAHDQGLVEIPLQIDPPDDHTFYVHVTRVCLRLALTAKATCIPDWLLFVAVSTQSGTTCDAKSERDVFRAASVQLDRLESPDSPDTLKLLAALHPDEAAALIGRAFKRASADTIGLRLDLLDAMGALRDGESLAVLRKIESDPAESTSMRFRALESLSRRDPSIDKRGVWLRWAHDGEPDLAAKAIEELETKDLTAMTAACRDRLARRSCADGQAWVDCMNVKEQAVQTIVEQWRKACP